MAVLALTGIAPVLAQQRDPTVPPADVFPTATNSEADARPKAPWGSEGMAVVVRDGKSYLVVDTRLYTVGQKIGAWRIERISETEVWLKDGAVRRKVPRFGGIERRNAVMQPPAVRIGTKAKARRPGKMIHKANTP